MPATGVMTTSKPHTARRKPSSEPVAGPVSGAPHAHPAQRFHQPDPDFPGPAIALITTGGYTGCPLTTAEELGIRISGWVHCADFGAAAAPTAHGANDAADPSGAGVPDGGSADPTFAETVQAFAGADGIGAIAACLDRVAEGGSDGRMLIRAAEAAAGAGVPMVVLASGGDRVAEAVLRQAGVVRVDGFDQLLDCAQTLARFPRPPQRPGPLRVAADSPAVAAHLADLAARAGLEVEAAGSETEIPDLAARPGAGMLLYAVTGTGAAAERAAQQLAEAGRAGGTPVCVIWCSSGGNEAGYRLILQGSPDIVAFRTLTNGVAAAKAYYDHCDHRFRIPAQAEEHAMAGVKARQILLPERGSSAAARRQQVSDSKGLSESQTHQLLRAYGIRTPREQLVTSAAWAVRAAATIGYPVVMKASVAGLPSSSAAGLTRTNITSASQVRENFKDLLDSAGRQGYGTLDGVLIGQQITGGVDTMVGIRRDARFGPVVVVGVGGAYAETLGDIAVRVAPFDAHQARRMLDELHCLPLLTTAGADLDALADTIVRVQRMALDLGDILDTFDIAPLRVLGRGGGTVALDAAAVLLPRA